MEQLNKIKVSMKEYIESYYFLAFMALLSIITIFVPYKVPFLFVFAVVLLCVVLFSCNFKSVISLLVYYYSLQQGRQLEIPSPTYFILLGLYSLIFLVLLIQVIRKRNEFFPKLKKDFLLYSMLLILAFMLLSLINTEDFGLSAIGIGNFALTILAYIFVKMTVDMTEENKNYIIISIITSALVISIGCIYMIFFKLHEGFNFWDIFNRKLLSFGWLHSNHYTAFVNIAAILCIYLFIKYKEVWKRILLVLSLFLFLIVEAFTVCRAGILALGITLILSIIVYFIYNKKYEKRKIWKDFFYLIPFVIGIILGIIFMWHEGILQELIDRFQKMGISENGRNDVYDAALAQFRLHPIIGSGVYTSHLYTEFWNYHNYVLQMLGTCGILGLLGFIIYLFFSVKRTLQKNLYSVFVGILILYFLIHGAFDTMYFHNLLMPLLVVLQALQEDKKIKEEFKKDKMNEEIELQ